MMTLQLKVDDIAASIEAQQRILDILEQEINALVATIDEVSKVLEDTVSTQKGD